MPDRLSQQIDGVAQPEKGIKEMSTSELRQAAANTLQWLWDTTEDAYLEMRDSLHVHVNTESRDHMQAAGRIVEGADLLTGEFCALHCTEQRAHCLNSSRYSVQIRPNHSVTYLPLGYRE